MTTTTKMRRTGTTESKLQQLQDIVGTDVGDRGMKALIVPGDLLEACRILGQLPPPQPPQSSSTVLILSGFPCCVNETPPTETDGPPGAYAIARTAMALGHDVVVITDTCNQGVFEAALQHLVLPVTAGSVSLQCFPNILDENDQQRLDHLAATAKLIIAIERAGPAHDGNCYTMRGINMTEFQLIAPLDKLLVHRAKKGIPFLAIGDGGNELGMGKVLDQIISNPKIQNATKIACVIAADHLIAASVSNWGGYALAAGAALIKADAHDDDAHDDDDAATASYEKVVQEWIDKCLPTEQDEMDLLQRCVAAGCRDGVSGKLEATVDGMPLQVSMQCLRDIRNVALSSSPS
jgi:D-glutamate cyclase